jgi:hypothetical protein
MYVALGGGAKHLKQAVSRLKKATSKSNKDGAAGAMRGYKGLI